MLIGIATTDVIAAGANGAAGPQVIAPIIDRVVGDEEGVDRRHEGLPRARAGAGRDGGVDDRLPDIATPEGVEQEGPPLTGVALLRWTMADPVAREALRFRIEETAEPISAIAKEFPVSHTTVTNYVRREGWVRRHPKAPKAPAVAAPPRRLAASIADAGMVTGRLIRVVDRQVGKMDARLKKRNSEIEEKDSRILGHLARTLATLMALDRDGGATAKEPERVDRDELNADLARRIRRWAQGGDEPA
jgi:hypothetical protein